MIPKFPRLFATTFSLLLMTFIFSCKTKEKFAKDFNYFQTGLDTTIPKVSYQEYKFRENDIVTVQVVAGSISQEDAVVYNLTGGENSNKLTASASAGAYQIDSLGNIDVPKIGKIKAIGLTKYELADIIKTKIRDEVKNPLVVVKLNEFRVNVLGEVRKPGVVIFKTDKVNILDAISEAGDLTDAGKRENIILMRQLNGKYETYTIDLRNTKFINSPAFQLSQNDIIYVSANMAKLKALNADPSAQSKITIALAAITAISLVINTFGLIKK